MEEMMRKKLVSMLLMAALAATVVTGCGSTGASTKKAQKNADGAVEIDFWFSGGKTAVNVLQKKVDSFNDSQDKYHINTVTQADYTETYEKLQAGIAGKKAPDVALLDVDKARNLSNKKLVADIQPFVDKDKDFQKDDYLEVFFNQGYDESGKLFALPAYGTTQVMYYNKEQFEKAGVKAENIKTWQDLADAAKKIHEKDSKVY